MLFDVEENTTLLWGNHCHFFNA